MKTTRLIPLLLLLATPLAGRASEQLVPAGSLIQCTLSEPRLSSKTLAVGDPVLCQVSRLDLYSRVPLPTGSYLEGRFEDYKDPGHLVGKGWMELRFDRLIIEPDTVIPISAKVVDVPKYPVDKEGRIHGTGHAVRDVLTWSLPILWPIDLINLPRRGPRPTLKSETRITLKIMDDFAIGYADPRATIVSAQQPAAPIERRPMPAPTQQLQPMSYAAPQQPRLVHPTVIYAYPPPPAAPYRAGYFMPY